MKYETEDKILKGILESDIGLTTVNIAAKIGLSRSATSLYLNELAKSNKIMKSSSYPVLWSKLKNEDTYSDVFDNFVGATGSAKKMINACKAAILYPPSGLPILLHGNSGVGKTYLARLIFNYLKTKKATCSKSFIVFNCADYANNPELLSSILFGHKKGAYTGADRDSQGLLKKADNGVLFLDEVHRLSFENQEKLFQFMDSGNFRPIGDENTIESAKVRLIMATTEEPKEVLLPTFFRRIPTILELPDYHLRPIQERELIIRQLFFQEAQKIGKEILIDKELLDELLHNKMSGNIGQLENKVKMYCAEGLQKNQSNDHILIGNHGDPTVEISKSIFVDDRRHANIELLDKLKIEFEQTHSLERIKEILNEFAFAELHEEYSSIGCFSLVRLKQSILDHMISIMGNSQKIAPFIDQIIFLLTLEDFLPTKLLSELVGDIIKMDYPRTNLLAEKTVQTVSIEFRERLHLLLTIFLAGSISEDLTYQALLVAHGNSTASSIQSVTNQLCGDYLFDAINMPLNASMTDIIKKVRSWLAERDTSKGVIMLVDMGSLTQLYKSLKPEIKGELLVINNLTTSFALDIGHQILNHNIFYEIIKSSKKNFETSIQYFEGFSNDRNIIISSILGFEIAKKLKNLFESYINPEIKIIVMNFNELLDLLDRENNDEGYLKTTELLVTTSFLENKTKIPSINILDILDDEIDQNLLRNRFGDIINQKYLSDLTNQCIFFFSKEGLSEKLNFLNPEIIIKQVETIIEKMERRFNINLNMKVKYNLTMHLSLMIERTMLGPEEYQLPVDIHQLLLNDLSFHTNIKDLLYFVEEFYNISITDWELFVLYEILDI